VTRHSLQLVQEQLSALRSQMIGVEERFFGRLDDLSDDQRNSARNLLHYLALRQRDLRPLQAELTSLGLSSLGRAESQVMDTVRTVLEAVDGLASSPAATDGLPAAAIDGRRILRGRTDALFGTLPAERDVRIMVTMPAEAARDYGLVRDLIASGMDCARINCAHDDRDTWAAIRRHIATASDEMGRQCRVLMDLAGPKLRTGPIEPGPPVVRWKPRRDVCGRVVAPARIWLTPYESPRPPAETAAAILSVRGSWLAALVSGDEVSLIDARDANRTLRIVARGNGGVWAESDQTAYIMPGTSLLRATRPGDGERRTHVTDIPPTVQTLLLAPGDTLMLTRSEVPGRPAIRTADGLVLQPAVIGVTLGAVFDDVKVGERIWFDDGRIGGEIAAVSPDRLEVNIIRAAAAGSTLGADKGINLPDTTLTLPSLTAKDLEDLQFIAAHADIVGYSFVRTEADVRELQAQLAVLGRADLPLILKIETRRAFDNLPGLLLAAMRSSTAGVMIARGDLAVECGYERLAEVQEEILWMAEASHTPVIWATQVLERLAKDGIPSRAEITDAAMGERAECVMLNKGPHILTAVRALDDILTRMQAHQRKKTAMLRHLGLADRFLNPLSS
jgi:pyruvate kinase